MPENDKNDLHLSCRRQPKPFWRLKPSRNVGYYLPVYTYLYENCEVFLQGYCLSHLGHQLTIENVAKIIRESGIQALNHLDGSFVIAVNDRNGGAWCATDPSGSLPLYYRVTPEDVNITISPKSIPFSSTQNLDLDGIFSFLNSGYPWGELTLLQEWKVLGPGRLLQINANNQIEFMDYFDPETSQELRGFSSPDEILAELDRSLTSIATRYKKILITLSGGVDSRLIAIRCHQLGIPFEAITFVANNSLGDDFDIACQLARIMDIKHHRWEWTPTNCIENFKKLIVASGGMSDAYTSYPDGMDFFSQISSSFDCVIRGDENFGCRHTSLSILESTDLLNMRIKDKLSWVVKPNVTFCKNVESLLQNLAYCDTTANGLGANAWKNRFYLKTRLPRFIMPVARWEAQHTAVTYPYLTRAFIIRMSQTGPNERDNKRIIREALAKCSPASIQAIPHSTSPTWNFGEPLLNLPDEIISEMKDILLVPSKIDEIIDANIVTHRFVSTLKPSSENSISHEKFVFRVKSLLKKITPQSALKMFKPASVSHLTVREYFIFKRLFAIKVYLTSFVDQDS